MMLIGEEESKALQAEVTEPALGRVIEGHESSRTSTDHVFLFCLSTFLSRCEFPV